MVKKTRRQLIILGITLMIGACAQSPVKLYYELGDEKNKQQWPLPPEKPRFEYVGQLVGEADFRAEDGERPGGLRGILRWIVGSIIGRETPRSLQRPQMGVVDNKGRIFITDVGAQGVMVFDVVAGKFRFWSQASRKQNFIAPTGITLGEANTILVADAERGYVTRLSKAGKPLGKIGEKELIRPVGITRNPASGDLYVSDARDHKIKLFDKNGKWIKNFGEFGEKNGQFNAPTYLSFYQDKLYVADTLNARIQVFDKDGQYVQSIGQRGRQVGNLSRPKGVALDKRGHVYVIESYYDHLLVFNSQGQLLLPIGGQGKGIGKFYLPSGVWIKNNKIYIADMFNGRVVVFKYLEGV